MWQEIFKWRKSTIFYCSATTSAGLHNDLGKAFCPFADLRPIAMSFSGLFLNGQCLWQVKDRYLWCILKYLSNERLVWSEENVLFCRTDCMFYKTKDIICFVNRLNYMWILCKVAQVCNARVFYRSHWIVLHEGQVYNSGQICLERVLPV